MRITTPTPIATIAPRSAPSARVRVAAPTATPSATKRAGFGSSCAVGAEQDERHEHDVERLGHQRRFAEEEHRVDGGERGRGEPDRARRDPATEQPDQRHGARPDEGQEDALLVDRVQAEARRHREQYREERRVLRGRTLQVEQQVVERPDVAAAVRQLLGQQVVRARVAERRNFRRDHDDEHDADPERNQRDRSERESEPLRVGRSPDVAHLGARHRCRLTRGRQRPR